jgi:hypothetical protein
MSIMSITSIPQPPLPVILGSRPGSQFSSRMPSPAPSDRDAPPLHDPDYYFHDDMAIFLVSDVTGIRRPSFNNDIG